MLSRVLLPVFLMLLAAAPLRAEPRVVGPLVAALDLDRLIAVMRREGLAYGDDLAAELFPDDSGPRWQGAVAAIHDPARMKATVVEALDAELAGHPAELSDATAFFAGAAGRRIVGLELSAREALLDDATREAAELAFEDMQATAPQRVVLLDRFAAVNDLVESNVAGALNSNLAFYRGMLAGGSADVATAERDMLADLWAQEPQIRDETVIWLYPYLAMSYDTLSDAELQAYIDFSRSAAGQKLNRALFAAFDRMLSAQAYDLGVAVARHLQGQDI